MTSIELYGRVNEQGELEIEKPQGLPVGKKVKVTITELDEIPEQRHWGENFVKLLDQLDLSDWQSGNISDPSEVVRHERQEQAKRRGLIWGDE